MTLLQSFSPPSGLGAAKQFALDGGSCLLIALVKARCGEQMRCSPQRGLTGPHGDGIIKEQEGMTLLQSFSPPFGLGAAKQVERWMAARAYRSPL